MELNTATSQNRLTPVKSFKNWLQDIGLDTNAIPNPESYLDRYFGELQQIANSVFAAELQRHDLQLRRKVKLTPHRKKDRGKIFVSVKTNRSGVPFVDFHSFAHGGISEIVSLQELAFQEYQEQLTTGKPACVQPKPASRPAPQKPAFDTQQWRAQKFAEFSETFKTLPPATESGYFASKGLEITPTLQQSLNLRRGMDKERGGFVAYPLWRGGKQVGFQQLFDTSFVDKNTGETRNKHFIGETGKAYAVIGKPERQAKLIFVEGLATGITCHLASDAPVVVCLDAGNLPKVAKVFRNSGFLKGLIAADFDTGKDGSNVGLFAALEAGKQTGYAIAYPDLNGQKCDFDDLRQALDLDAVKKQLKAAKNRLKTPKSRAEFYALRAQLSPKNQALKFLKAAAIAAGKNGVCLADRLEKAIALNAIAEKRGIGLELFNALTLMEWVDAKLAQKTIAENSLTNLMNIQTLDTQKNNLTDIKNTMLKTGGIWLDNRPMGAGKTQLMAEIAESVNELPFADRHLTYFAHRVSLIKSAAERLGFAYYDDVCFWAGEQPEKLAVCVNSIVKLNCKSRGGILFIDEIRQTLESVLNGKVENRLQVYQDLIASINNAFLVIGADADLNQFTLDFLKSVSNHPIHLITDSQKPKQAALEELSNADAVIKSANDCLQNGSRVWLATDSVKQAEKAAKYLTEKNPAAPVLLVTSENKADTAQAAFLANPNIESLNYRAVIHTPVISSGVSITHGEFKTVFGIFQNVISPHEILQMLGRVRGADHIILSFAEVKTERTKNPLLLFDGEEKKRARFLSNGLIKLDEFDTLRINAKITANAALNDYRPYFFKLASLKGFTIKSTANRAEKINIPGLSAAVNAEKMTAVLDARVIDKSEAKKLKKANATTQADSHALKLFDIAETTGKQADEITAEDIQQFNDGRLTTLVKNRELLDADTVQLKIEDQLNHLSREKTQSKTSTQHLGKTLIEQLSGKELTAIDAATAADWLNQNAAEIAANGLGDFSKPSQVPIKTVNRFLFKYGFELVESQHKRENGGRVRYFKLEENAYVAECIARRTQQQRQAEMFADDDTSQNYCAGLATGTVKRYR